MGGVTSPVMMRGKRSTWRPIGPAGAGFEVGPSKAGGDNISTRPRGTPDSLRHFSALVNLQDFSIVCLDFFGFSSEIGKYFGQRYDQSPRSSRVVPLDRLEDSGTLRNLVWMVEGGSRGSRMGDVTTSLR